MGRALGAADSTSCSKFIQLGYISTTVTRKFFIAPFACVVTDIRGATRVAGAGGACTMSFFKAADTVAVGSGVLLHAGSFNVVGTADTNQILVLTNDQSALTLKAGDSIGVVVTGTATSAVGEVTVTIEPLS